MDDRERIGKRMGEMGAVVEARLDVLLAGREPALLWDSMAYSIQAGGKRLRPVLHLLANEMGGGDAAEALDMACAIEMIHTYSLIHDDLPALDNDTLRRGKATNHVVFGEAQAILTGDALLNYAYETMIANGLAHPQNLRAHLQAMSIVAAAAGVGGMIAGQVVDVAKEGEPISQEELTYIHTHKTADMITGALLSGLELAGPDGAGRAALEEYGRCIGLVFQIVDDVLDITAGEELGKTTGKDAHSGKTTYPTLYGVEGSLKIARDKNEQAKAALEPFGNKAEWLRLIADSMLTRRK